MGGAWCVRRAVWCGTGRASLHGQEGCRSVCHSFGKALEAKGCSGALWSQRGGLGGGKLRLLNEEAGGHEDMNPAVHVSQIVPSCARKQPPFGAWGRLGGVCCWMQL